MRTLWRVPVGMYLFVDLETTGSDPYRDVILEIAGILTADDLSELSSFERIVGFPKMGSSARWWPDAVQEMHERSGLWEVCAAWHDRHHLTENHVLSEFMSWIDMRHNPSDAVDAADVIKLAGSCVWSEREFLHARLPELDGRLDHRMLDLSSFDLLAGTVAPRLHAERPAPSGRHRAMMGCCESLALARYYWGALTSPEQDILLDGGRAYAWPDRAPAE